MKVTFDQLNQQLNKSLAPIYCVIGEEYLLVQEAVDNIRAKAKAAGYQERIPFTMDTNFNIQLLEQQLNNLSLFADKQIIELHTQNFKLSEANKNFLSKCCEAPPPDKLILFIANKLDAGTQNSHWFKAVDQQGIVLQIWPITFAQLPQWISARLQKHGLSAEMSGIKLLAERTEGNLLATAQEIEKLALLYPGQKLTNEQIATVIADSARYDVFNLVDSALQGQSAHTLRVLQGLKEEGNEPTLILWAITRELRNLINYAQAITHGQSLAQILTQNKVWERRKLLITKALKLNSFKQLQNLLQLSANIDKQIKGAMPGSVWDELQTLSLGLAGTHLN